MSAYVVEDKTINNPIQFLMVIAFGSGDLTHCIQPLQGLYDLTSDKDRERLAVDMFTLNCEAVNQRYGPNQAQEFRPLDFKFVDRYYGPRPQTLAKAVKSLQCWHYQCSEGNIPETSVLYRAIEQVIQRFAMHVFTHTREYQAAAWE